MSATIQPGKREARKEEIEQALKRVLTGPSFRTSAQCQALLRYIVENSLSRQDEMLRERVIGMKVFGRAPDYDAGNDPIVRARAAEVRKRLAQHYLQGDGVEENLRIDIPPGSYRAVFTTRDSSESSDVRRGSKTSESTPAVSASHAAERGNSSLKGDAGATSASASQEKIEQLSPSQSGWIRGRRFPALIVLTSVAVIMSVFGFVAGYFASTHRSAFQRNNGGSQALSTDSDESVAAFWTPFIKEDRSPIIAYADAMFLIDGSGDLFRFCHGAAGDRGASVDPHLARQFAVNPGLVAGAGPLFYDNGYTGTGDLRAMAMLTSQLGRLGATPLIESSYDISTDDMKQHNVILLGSSAEDLAVAQLVPTGDFLFEGPESNRDPWSDQIVNSQPRTGEQSHYTTVRDPATHVVQVDYAVISFQPGITPGHEIAILGGIDTTGTEGAALLLTSKAGVEELSNALTQVAPAPQTGRARAFQALVRVDVKKGYQVLDSRLVILHPVDVAKSAVARAYSSP